MNNLLKRSNFTTKHTANALCSLLFSNNQTRSYGTIFSRDLKKDSKHHTKGNSNPTDVKSHRPTAELNRESELKVHANNPQTSHSHIFTRDLKRKSKK
ncbi:hypothetical protein ABK040_004516 [Willaertia magna]